MEVVEVERMAQVVETEDSQDSRVRVIPGLEHSIEELELQKTRDHLFKLKGKYDSITLSRNIAALKAVSRIQHIPDSLRSESLKELRRQEMIRQILDGEFA